MLRSQEEHGLTVPPAPSSPVPTRAQPSFQVNPKAARSAMHKVWLHTLTFQKAEGMRDTVLKSSTSA